jgi:hypothetical protein
LSCVKATEVQIVMARLTGKGEDNHI